MADKNWLHKGKRPWLDGDQEHDADLESFGPAQENKRPVNDWAWEGGRYPSGYGTFRRDRIVEAKNPFARNEQLRKDWIWQGEWHDYRNKQMLSDAGLERLHGLRNRRIEEDRWPGQDRFRQRLQDRMPLWGSEPRPGSSGDQGAPFYRPYSETARRAGRYGYFAERRRFNRQVDRMHRPVTGYHEPNFRWMTTPPLRARSGRSRVLMAG